MFDDPNGDIASFGPSIEYEEGMEDDDDRMTEEEKNAIDTSDSD